MGARYYDAALGRFISADTVIASLANPQSLNRYAYVYNNPVNNTDPTGHRPIGDEDYTNSHGKPKSTQQKKTSQTPKQGGPKPEKAKSERHTRGDNWEKDGSPDGYQNYNLPPGIPVADANGFTYYTSDCDDSARCWPISQMHVFRFSWQQAYVLEEALAYKFEPDRMLPSKVLLDVLVDKGVSMVVEIPLADLLNGMSDFNKGAYADLFHLIREANGQTSLATRQLQPVTVVIATNVQATYQFPPNTGETRDAIFTIGAQGNMSPHVALYNPVFVSSPTVLWPTMPQVLENFAKEVPYGH
ncbi:MAG: hypothetical protein HY870_12355 [Chloroflexi bacterium]|nr:hypothetical protein [Chloroflexota bacterium]